MIGAQMFEGIVVVVALSCALVFLWIHVCAHVTASDLDRFQEHFPGKCPVCSFRRYGLLHGFAVEPPYDHVCPDEITRTESNRLPEENWPKLRPATTGLPRRSIIEVDVSRMPLRKAIEAVRYYEDIFIPVEGDLGSIPL